MYGGLLGRYGSGFRSTRANYLLRTPTVQYRGYRGWYLLGAYAVIAQLIGRPVSVVLVPTAQVFFPPYSGVRTDDLVLSSWLSKV